MGTVLIVDDSRATLDQLAALFRRLGHRPIITKAGASVTDTLVRESVDLVLLDLLMPEMDGIEVLRAIRRMKDDKLASTAVVMHSMARDSAVVALSLKSGAQDYVFKGIDPMALWLQVRKYLPDDDSGTR